MSLKTHALRGVFWNLCETLGTQATALGVFALLARLLDPAEIGLVQIATTLVLLLNIFVEAGFAALVVQTREIDDVQLDSAFWATLGSSALIGLGLALVAPLIADAYAAPDLVALLRVLSLVLVLSGLSAVQDALLLRRFAFRVRSLRRLVAVAAGGIAGVGGAYLGWGAWSLVAKQGVEALVNCAVLWATTPWRPKTRLSRSAVLEAFRFGRSMIGGRLADFLNRAVDDLIIGAALGPGALGNYAVAYRANVAVTEIAVLGASRTALPIFSRLQDDLPQFRQAHYTASRYIALVACPVFLGLTVTAPEVCAMLFGDTKWAASVGPMQVLGIASVALSAEFLLGPVLTATGRPSELFYFKLASIALNTLVLGTVVRFGLMAAAWSVVVRTLLRLPAALWLCRRAIETHTLSVLRAMSPAIIASGAMLVVVWLVRRELVASIPQVPVRLAALVVTGVLSYGAFVFLLAPGMVREGLRSVQAQRARAT